MLNDLFAEVPKEGGNIDLTELEEETTPESQTETVEPKEDAPSQEGVEAEEAEAPKAEDTPEEINIPFHKHPRWIQKQDEIQELRTQLEEFKAQSLQSPTATVKRGVPEHLQPVFGDNVEAYEAMEKEMNARAISAMESRQKEVDLRAKAEEAKNQEFVKWAETELSDIGQAIGKNLNDPKSTVRNQILDICDKYGVVDSQGRPNFQKAHELHKQLYPNAVSRETLDEKKKIAAKTDGKTSAQGSDISNVITSSKLRNTNIKSFF